MDVQFNEQVPQVRREVSRTKGIVGFAIARGFARDEAEANKVLLITAVVLVCVAIFFIWLAYGGSDGPTDADRARFEASTAPRTQAR